MPVVLTCAEVRHLLSQLGDVPLPACQLLFGSGLRLLECLRMRVKDIDFQRPDHSESELREILIGHSAHGRLLLVAFTDRRGKIRLVSAREVTRRERRDYEESQQDGA
jgi:uncharacterized DUF497 family protein